ncbi:hypothetical protein ACU4GD_05080 [Cupriavidus basilensis]
MVLNRLSVESRLPEDTIAALRARGHEVKVGEPWSEGRMSACTRERDAQGRLVLRAGSQCTGHAGICGGALRALRAVRANQRSGKGKQ